MKPLTPYFPWVNTNHHKDSMSNGCSENEVVSTHIRDQLLIQEANLLLCMSAIITSLHLSPHVAWKYFTCVMTWIPSSLFSIAKSCWHGRGLPRLSCDSSTDLELIKWEDWAVMKAKKNKNRRQDSCINVNVSASTLYWSWEN